MNNSIAAIILTYNEEKHISRCINSLKNICEEIFVIDSFSKDRTVEIAKEAGAQVYQNPWKNYATQFNWGLKNCPITTEWIWRIDADEFLEGNLGPAMKKALAECNNEVNGVYVRKRIDFMGKPLLHGGWYPSYHLKVWRRGHGECENRWMDEHIRIFSGTTITVEEGNQVDANLNDLTWWTEKHNGYATREMADMLMMEHRRGGVERYIASLPAYDGESGAVVCHANPFTRGHRHLVEYAAARCPHLYVFVLSEETGDFPAADRLELVRRGTADLPNVDVVPGGDYIISRATFPAYFLQGDPEQARCDLELTLFGKRIAPALGITRRFVGQEPYSPVTARYNQRMQALLPQWGIRVEEIPRLEGISASRVRQLLRQGRLAELQPLVPETTYAYCRDHFGAGAPCP